MISKYWNLLQQKYRNQKLYFKQAEPEIRKKNADTFWQTSIILTISMLCLIPITHLILPKWRMSVFHYALIGAMLIFTLAAFCFYKVNSHTKVEKYVQFSYITILMMFVGILDTIPFPTTSQIFVSALLVVTPIIFIVPFGRMLACQFVYFIYFVIMTFHFKEEALAQKDVMAVIIGLVIGFSLYVMIMQLRIDEYFEKSQYKLSSEIDALTGIPNRASCREKIDYLLAKGTEKQTCAMIVVDVDNFKKINDSLGHGMGDEVLKEIAKVLMGEFRKEDVVGRFGGDEFIVFFEDVNDIEFIKRKCTDINEQLKYILDGRFGISCSMGICIGKTGGATLEALFKVADAALYEAKTFEKGNFVIHECENGRLKESDMHMVIVDDIPVDREVIAAQFEDDYSVIKFAEGETALKYIMENAATISVVLLDMIMPGLRGEEVLKKLKSEKRTAGVPIVVISADEMTEEEVLALGADDMITKPIIPAITKLRVKKVMRKAGR